MNEESRLTSLRKGHKWSDRDGCTICFLGYLLEEARIEINDLRADMRNDAAEIISLRAAVNHWKKAEHDLSAAYLRLRDLIPGAYDTPHAPTSEQVWETTERALKNAILEFLPADVRKIERNITTRGGHAGGEG